MVLIVWFTGSVGDESTEIKNYSWKMLKEETNDLKAQYLQQEYCSSRMPMQYSGHHHQHLSTFSADSLALFTPHVSISQPSSSSPSSVSTSEAEHTMVARYFETTIPPRFIDFLGVGAS